MSDDDQRIQAVVARVLGGASFARACSAESVLRNTPAHAAARDAVTKATHRDPGGPGRKRRPVDGLVPDPSIAARRAAADGRVRIYFIGCRTVEWLSSNLDPAWDGIFAVKIGHTTDDHRKRVVGVQTGSPLPVVCLRWVHGSRDLERALHGALSGTRLHGEWFRYDARLHAFIASINDGDRLSPDEALEALRVAR